MRPGLPPSLSSSLRRHGGGLLVLGLAYVAAIVIGQSLPFQALELSTVDMRYRVSSDRFAAQESPIVVVDIDDDAEDALHAVWPWPRHYYARLIRNLRRAGARAIVFDIELPERHASAPAGDDSLAAELRETSDVLLAGEISFTGYEVRASGQGLGFVTPQGARTTIKAPHEMFRGAADGGWALANVDPDIDGVVREYYTYRRIADDTRLYPTLALSAYTLVTERDPPAWTDSTESFHIAYPGGARTFPYYSFAQAIDDSSIWTADEDAWGEDANWYDTLRDAGVFQDKVVFVGASMAVLHDLKFTPFSKTGQGKASQMPGVEVHAAALHTLLNNHRISEIHPIIALAVLLGVCLLAFTIGILARTWVYLLSVVTTGIVWWTTAFALFGTWALLVPIVTPLLALGAVSAGQLAWLFYLEQVRRRQITSMFGHYVPPQVVRQLVRDPEKARLGGERRELSVMFADVVGFTGICEDMSPEQIVELLNEYLTAMTEIIHKEGGIIDKYEGDLIMAEFGVPLPMLDHALRACRTAFLMRKRLYELHERWRAEGKPLLEMRIGIGTGPMVFGNMGSSQAFDYTVMGDVVNLAARLETANRAYGTHILINGRAAEMVNGAMLTREIDRLLVKGKQHPETCHQLIAPADSPKATQIRRVATLFAEGLRLYREQCWSDAIAAFGEVLSIWDDDRPSRLFIERCEQYMCTPPEGTWDGVFTMVSK